MGTASDQAKLLRIYLENHLAGATAGSQRASRLADAEADSPHAAVLAGFAAEVAADLDALTSVMQELDVEPNRLKTGIASVAEKLGTLKPNGRLVDRSPLSTVVEVEAMQMAVSGKRSLWETLRTVMSSSTVDFDGLIAGADRQLAALAAVHADRVPPTFGSAIARTVPPRSPSNDVPASDISSSSDSGETGQP